MYLGRLRLWYIICSWSVLNCPVSTGKIEVRAGSTARIPFTLSDSQNTSFKIQISNSRPFYYSTRSELDAAGLTEDQRGRFSVHTDQNTITVVIEDVKRNDQATYIFWQENGVGRISRTFLLVKYPPGKAHCKFQSENVDVLEWWAILECSAAVGNLEGFIECYQDCEKIPFCVQWNNATALTSTFWITKSLAVGCCSSAYDEPKRPEDCQDFSWDQLQPGNQCPNPAEEVTSQIHTRPNIQAAESTATPDKTVDTNEASSDQSQCPSNTTLHVFIALTVILSGLSIILSISVCFLKKKQAARSSQTQDVSPEAQQMQPINTKST